MVSAVLSLTVLSCCLAPSLSSLHGAVDTFVVETSYGNIR